MIADEKKGSGGGNFITNHFDMLQRYETVPFRIWMVSPFWQNEREPIKGSRKKSRAESESQHDPIRDDFSLASTTSRQQIEITVLNAISQLMGGDKFNFLIWLRIFNLMTQSWAILEIVRLFCKREAK